MNSIIYKKPCRYLLLQHGVVGVPRVAGGDEIVGDDGDLLGEQSADVETELDHGGGSAAVAVAVAVVWEMMLHHLISTGHSDYDVTPRLCTLVSLSANSGASYHHHYLPSTYIADYQGSAGQGRSCLDSICTVRIESQMKI